jgi:hypothetical protein
MSNRTKTSIRVTLQVSPSSKGFGGLHAHLMTLPKTRRAKKLRALAARAWNRELRRESGRGSQRIGLSSDVNVVTAVRTKSSCENGETTLRDRGMADLMKAMFTGST